jgi:uncharacterized membrane protein YhfC
MLPLFVSGTGMMLVAVLAVVIWRCIGHTPVRWYWVGAGLWAIAVALKILDATLTSAFVLSSLKSLPYPIYILLAGLYCGIQSAVFEMGITLVAVLIWRRLGQDAERSIAIGVGAGAFEAFLLGVAALAGAVFATVSTGPAAQKIIGEMGKTVAVTPLLWLAGPVERVLAILCHASSRALILLGVTKRRYLLVFWGFLLFALLDGVAGAFIVGGGRGGKISVWWIELACLPFAIVSVPILTWCCRRYSGKEIGGEVDASETEPIQLASEDRTGP